MIIEQPRISRTRTEIQISARVTSPFRRKGAPQDLWFRFPAEFESQISLDADPFVVALILLAMQGNEPIQVQGSLSRQLLRGLGEYQGIYHQWFPDRFHQIEIRAQALRGDPVLAAHGAGCAFSGGVDSTYSFLNLSREMDGSAPPLTHALFMAGFDMPLNLTASIGELTQSYAQLMRDCGIQFVSGSTNVRDFVNPTDWTNAHGQALAASALFFKSVWQRFYIPSSYLPELHPKWGSHPDLDPLLSTEAMEMVHHGGRLNRVQKLAELSQSPETYSRLRVCWIQDIGLKNCGACEKCVRTMIGLDLLGVLARYSTFQTALTRSNVRALKMRTHQARVFARELIQEAKQRGRWDVVLDLNVALLRRAVLYRARVAFKKWAHFRKV